MKNTQAKKIDLSLLFMGAVVVAMMILLSGCNPNTNDSDDSTIEEPEAAVPIEVAVEVVEEVVEEVVLAEPVEVVVAGSTSSYQVGALQTYSQSKFDEAVANGDTVLLDFHADWCSICRGNAPKIENALEGTGVVGLQVDFDTAYDLRLKYGVSAQSTLIVLKNGQETKRTLGSQSDETLAELLQ